MAADPNMRPRLSPALVAIADEPWFREAVELARRAAQILAEHGVGATPEGGATITLPDRWFLARTSEPLPRAFEDAA